MTRTNLIQALENLGVPRSTYDFEVQTPDIDLLGKIDGVWSLYFVERGQVSIVQQFSSESDLYEFFLSDATKQQQQRLKTQSMSDDELSELFGKISK
jgi:hypothetical protein